MYVLFLSTSGAAVTVQKISNSDGGLAAHYTLDIGRLLRAPVSGARRSSTLRWATSTATASTTLRWATYGDDDGGSRGKGAFYLIFATTSGTVGDAAKVSMLEGGFASFYTLTGQEDTRFSTRFLAW